MKLRQAILIFTTLTLFELAIAQFPATCPPAPPQNGTPGSCPTYFTLIGPSLEPVHESISAPTGLAIDPDLNLYLAYPRNAGATPNNVVKCTSFTTEEPWPTASIQNCTAGQNVSTCFVNVQNIVLDNQSQLWVVDSGIPPGGSSALEHGAKIMSFSLSGELRRTYIVPDSLYHDKLFLNDIRINNTIGTNGYAFLTDASALGSLVTIDLDTGFTQRRLFNTTFTRPDEGFVGVYNGQPIYLWNGTQKSYGNLGSDGIALASGNVYWGVLSSRRFYYVSQAALIDPSITEESLEATVQDPGQCGTEQAGFTADSNGRVYIMASEQNAIFYVDTLRHNNGTSQVSSPGSHESPATSQALEPIPAAEYVVKDYVRSALIQHADSAAIWDGWMYFCTNQLELAPARQYMNVDARKGPFRSYRVWIGAGPAV